MFVGQPHRGSACEWRHRGFLSPISGTPLRPPEVSTNAFATHLPDLQPWTLMDMDFAIISPLVRPERLVSDFCSSGQRFACGFLQIPPHDGHPCRPANSSPCRACRGLSPPSGCALPGAPIKKAAHKSCLFSPSIISAGGGGGSRTRVRKYSLKASTCIAGVLILALSVFLRQNTNQAS